MIETAALWPPIPPQSAARSDHRGLVWIALSAKGYGIHGTPDPGKISKRASHGCIRLTNWDALELARHIGKGTPVTIEGGQTFGYHSDDTGSETGFSERRGARLRDKGRRLVAPLTAGDAAVLCVLWRSVSAPAQVTRSSFLNRVHILP
jgi:hypothetical protein